MKKSEGFALADLALALGIFGIVSSVLVLNYFKEQKQETAKEIASALIAIDRGFNTLALSQQIIPTYRGENKPTPFPTLTSSVYDETDYVEEILRKSYGRNLSNLGDDSKGISLIDPRINLKSLAERGYSFTFNVKDGFTLESIYVSRTDGSEIDEELSSYLSGILGDKWDKQRKVFKLNDGKGYKFTPFYITKAVANRNVPVRECWIHDLFFRKCGTVWRRVPVWGNVLVGYRLTS